MILKPTVLIQYYYSGNYFDLLKFITLYLVLWWRQLKFSENNYDTLWFSDKEKYIRKNEIYNYLHIIMIIYQWSS